MPSHVPCPPRLWAVPLALGAAVWLGWAGPLAAGEPAGPSATPQPEDAAPVLEEAAGGGTALPAPWRGSQFIWRNAVGTTSLNPDYQTFNPYYAMVFSFEPRWYFSEQLFLRASLDVTRELTQADDTTYAGEAWLGDLSFAVGMSHWWTIPVVGIDLSAELQGVAPTSKLSQARSLVVALRPSLRLTRSFDLLGGLTLGTSLRAGPSLHRYTTAQTASPLIPGCAASAEGCSRYLHSGLRNPVARLQQTFDVSLAVLDWLSTSVVFGYAVDWLTPLSTQEQISLEPQSDPSQRFYSLLALEVTFRPLPALEVGVGYQAFLPQLAPDSTYYNPFDNPYATLFIDLRLDVAGLISTITGADAERSSQYDL